MKKLIAYIPAVHIRKMGLTSIRNYNYHKTKNLALKEIEELKKKESMKKYHTIEILEINIDNENLYLS